MQEPLDTPAEKEPLMMSRRQMKLQPGVYFDMPEQHSFEEDNKLPEKEVLTDHKQDPEEESEASTEPKEDSDEELYGSNVIVLNKPLHLQDLIEGVH